MREQICLIVCPYGRLQGVLLDKDSIVVAYDHVRGEPRGKLTEKSIHGDCIDCKLCVQVCPTGIDIRNGTQLECINCAACIDACDSIMDRIEKPKGLIRYASLNQIIKKTKFKITPRLIAYAAVYIILLTTLVTAIVLRSDVEATILRTPGMLYQRNQDNDITNIYNFNLINKTFNDVPVELRLKNIQGNLKVVGNDIKVPGVGNYDGVLIITVPEDKVDHNKNKINIEVVSNNKVIDNIETTFFGPVHKKHIQP
jgi:cytochrome c oxidase accessory protein FixG